MSWVVLRSISRSVFLQPTSVRHFRLPIFNQKRLISVTRPIFSASEITPLIKERIDLINTSRRSARQPHYEELAKIITKNIESPELITFFREEVNKGASSPFLDTLAKSNPARTANFLIHLDKESLAKVYFDLSYPELCQIVENVIVQKGLVLTPDTEISPDAKDIAYLVPHNKKIATWEEAFVDFIARHTADELLPNELDDKLSTWICEKLYPIAAKQAKHEGKITEVLDLRVSGFVSILIGQIITKMATLNNWDDVFIGTHVYAIGGYFVNFGNNLSFAEKANIWVSLIVSVSHHDQVVKKKNTICDVRLLNTIVTEVTKTWTYNEKIEIGPLITNLIEPRGSLLAFFQYLRNLM